MRGWSSPAPAHRLPPPDRGGRGAGPRAAPGAAAARADGSRARRSPAPCRRPTIARLPRAVRDESEEYVDACGAAFDVEIGDDFAERRCARLARDAHADRRRPHVRGPRLRPAPGHASRAIHANGIAIDDVVVLHESPLRRMDPEEAAADATVRAQCGAPGPRCIGGEGGRADAGVPRARPRCAHQAAPREGRGARSAASTRPGAKRRSIPSPACPTATSPPPRRGRRARRPCSTSAWTSPTGRAIPVAAATVQSTMDGAVNTYYQDTSYDKTSLRTTVTPDPAPAPDRGRLRGERRRPDPDRRRRPRRAPPASTAPTTTSSSWPSRGCPSAIPARPAWARAGVWLNGSFGSSVTAHELGHNYGVHHATSGRRPTARSSARAPTWSTATCST